MDTQYPVLRFNTTRGVKYLRTVIITAFPVQVGQARQVPSNTDSVFEPLVANDMP